MRRALGVGIGVPLLLGEVAWACAALYLDLPRDTPSADPSQAGSGTAALLAATFAGVSLALFSLVRPLARAIAAQLGVFLLVLLWWLSIEPSNQRAWMPDVARTATSEIEGDWLTLHNVRNFDYSSRDEYRERWETRRYDLSSLKGVDLFLSYWGSPWIAHTVMSWEFDGGEHLAISIETRKEEGEVYSAVRGFFRQFELYYVVADERDLIRLRTNYRDEDVYLYHLTTPLEVAKAILLDYMQELNRLAAEPKWYNAVTHNCTTVIRHHAQNVARTNPWNWRILLNGRLDELGYMQKALDTSLPFRELRERSRINQRAKAAGNSANFSTQIRAGLPTPR